jgi:hypothetical protein
MKTCIKCKIEKEFTEFSKDKGSKDGFYYYCKECTKVRKKQYRLNNKEKIKLGNKKYNENNKEKIKPYHKNYYGNNKNYFKKRNKEYRKINKEKEKEYLKVYRQKNKEKIKENYRQRIKSDPLFKLSNNIRSMIASAIKKNGYKKLSKTEYILGCSFEEFQSHLEFKFEHWMTWDNRGLWNGNLNYGWDIDHIVPLSSAKTEDELIRLNHYTNLQPLCSHTNRYIKKNLF